MDSTTSTAEPISGFLLTRSSRDINGSTLIQYWVATDNGPALLSIYDEKPVLFIEQVQHVVAEHAAKQAGLSVVFSTLQLKTFSQQGVVAAYSANIHTHFRLQDSLKAASVEVLESDFRLHDRYLMERFITAGLQFVGVPVKRDGFIEYQHARIKPFEYRPKLRLMSLDIECDFSGELFSIGLITLNQDEKGVFGSPIAEVLMIGEPQSVEEGLTVTWVSNERELLAVFLQRVAGTDPDIIIGWSVVNFDLRLLMRRCERHRMAFTIGRDEQVATWRDAIGSNGQGYISIAGRVAVDGIDALKTGMYQMPSFSLEQVSQALLGRGKKVEGSVEDRLAEIKHNFLHDKPKLAAYNLEDCQLVIDIFAKTKILDFLQFRSQITGLELDRQGGSVAAFTNLYLPKLHRAGYVAPNLPADGGLASPGGYVMDSRPGLYKRVLVLDYKSLYPSIIRTFKIDPLGLIEGGLPQAKETIPGFRGAKFHREKHFLPEIIAELWQQRDTAKAHSDAPRSQAIKILMNSFYGVLGSGGCRFYDTRLASSITLRGHEIMQTSKSWIEEQGYRVIYGDTDSTFVWLEQEVDDQAAHDIGKALAAMINQRWQEKLQQDFTLECELEIEYETYYSRFLMPTIRGAETGSKKRYAGLKCWQEDAGGKSVRKTDLVFKGLESVRSDWTPLAKQFQQQLYEMVFHDQDPSEYVAQVVSDTLAGKYDAELVYRKRIRRPLQQYVKNVPPQIRAAREADAKNRAAGKPLRYQQKGWISYVVTTQGPQAVEYVESILDYKHYIDKQLKPIAESILPFIGVDFSALTDQQQQLF